MADFVYILKCSDKTLYTGAAKNPREREEVHNSGKGARYTRCRLPVKLLYWEECDSWSEALKREYQIKKLSRTQKLKLISSEEKSE